MIVCLKVSIAVCTEDGRSHHVWRTV